MHDPLLVAVSREEIVAVIKKLPSNKAPAGPNGYTLEFFRAAWDVIGDQVVDVVQEFFMLGLRLNN